MRKLKEKLFLKEYDEEKIKIANKTARASGASALNKDGSIRSVVGRYVLDNVSKDASILDFGSGPAAVQTLALRDAGFKNVSAYDFGVNTRDGIQDPDALNKKYDVVFASNVLNVSSDEEMLRETLRDIKKAAKNEIVFNYPSSPRKSGLNAQEVKDIIIDEYGVEPELVSGTKSAPVWKVLLNSSKNISEDTVKTRDGKWTNRGDSGETHGEFRTKKQADAQRKAIYASGWKKESVEDLANRVRKNDLEWDDEIEASYAEDGDVAVQFQDRETLTHEVTPYRSRRPRVSSNTWGRIWKDGNLVYNERGPKYKVRDDIIKKLNSMNESFESDLERKLVRMWFNEDQAAWLVKHDPETAEWLAYGNIRTQDLIDVEREINQKMAVKLIESVESTEFYGVFEKGGSIGKSDATRDNLHAWSGRDAGTLVKVFSSSDEAKNYAKRMRSRLSPGERSYYGMGYFVKKLSKKDLEHPQVIDMISNMPGSSASQVDKESLKESEDVWSTPESAAKSLFDRGLVASDYVERACKRHGKDQNFAYEVGVIISQLIEEDEHLGESKSIAMRESVESTINDYKKLRDIDIDTTLSCNRSIRVGNYRARVDTIYIQFQSGFDKYPKLVGYAHLDNGGYDHEYLSADDIRNYDLSRYMNGTDITDLEGMLRDNPSILFDVDELNESKSINEGIDGTLNKLGGPATFRRELMATIDAYPGIEDDIEELADMMYGSYKGVISIEELESAIEYMIDDALESTEAVNSSYSPELLNDLVNYYSSFDTMSYEEIWDEIVLKYNNEDLANDVIESLDNDEEDSEDEFLGESKSINEDMSEEDYDEFFSIVDKIVPAINAAGGDMDDINGNLSHHYDDEDRIRIAFVSTVDKKDAKKFVKTIEAEIEKALQTTRFNRVRDIYVYQLSDNDLQMRVPASLRGEFSKKFSMFELDIRASADL